MCQKTHFMYICILYVLMFFMRLLLGSINWIWHEVVYYEEIKRDNVKAKEK